MNPTLQASILALAEEYAGDDRVIIPAYVAGAQAMLDLLSKQGEGHSPRRRVSSIAQMLRAREAECGSDSWAAATEDRDGEEFCAVSELIAERARSAALVKALEKFQKIYTAGADGETAKSCCNGKHFSETLMAGDQVFIVSYAHADALKEAEAAPIEAEKEKK